MSNSGDWFVRTEDGNVYGPAGISTLVEWAKESRVEPSCFLSRDRISWTPAQLLPELEMEWLVETEPGRVYGPFNRALVVSMFATNAVPASSKAYRLHKFPVDEDPPPVEKIVEKVVEKIVEVEPSARTEIVVPEVVEPAGSMPPAKAPGSLFSNIGRERLAALEAAAQRELAKGRKLGIAANIFGRKH